MARKTQPSTKAKRPGKTKSQPKTLGGHARRVASQPKLGVNRKRRG